MDIGAFVQENKRWLIGVVVGFILFLIGQAVIESIYDPAAARSGLSRMRNQLPRELYGKNAQDDLLAEQEALQAERQRLESVLAFERGADYQVAAGQDAGSLLFEKSRELKAAIADRANERNVEVTEREIQWPVPSSVDEIKRVMFAIELLDEATKRLFAAHDAAFAADPDAVGLRSILQLRADVRKRSSRPRFRRGGRDGVDLADYVEQERVAFKFEADAATLTRFFESCREPGRTLVVENVQMQQPEQIGEPVVVQGTLTGIAFKESPK